MGTTDSEPTADAASLTAAVLEEEAARQAAQEASEEEILFADDLLPGVGAEEMSMREGLAKSGAATFLVLLVLNSLDELEGAALSVLAPDIRDALGVSDGVIVFIGAASAAFFVMGAMPMGWLVDRFKRPPIIGIASFAFAIFVFLSGLAVNAFMLFWTRFGVGLSKANTIVAHPSLLADTYPIAVRGRIFATTAMVGRAVAVMSPLIVGGIAAAAGGVEGWRWAYFLLGIPVAIFAFLAFRLKEPTRGQWEKEDVLGEQIDDEKPVPISVEAAFTRLWRIRTLKSVIVAFAAMGFILFTGAVLRNLYLEDHFGLGSFGRGAVETISGIGILLFVPFVGKFFDREYRKNPTRALATLGMLLIPAGILIPIQYAMPNVALFTVFALISNLFTGSAFAMVQPILQSIIPYRLRGMGSALATSYIFLIGAVGGGLVSAAFANALGPRPTIVLLGTPALIIGGLLILNGARFIRNDLSLVVAELREEQEEHERQMRDPENIPVLQVVDIDFAYGPVQVLFDVDFEVYRGEVLALLGTNGAGKSTILKVAAGLETPQRGVIRLNGQTVTYTTAEQRNGLGIQMLAGGKGVFPPMTVRDNLVLGAYPYRRDPEDVERRIERVLDLFPELRSRLSEPAGALSGGQQQMVALARTLMHEPEVLIIDELSLGLAPVVVEHLIGIVEDLKAQGMTIIIVEQSLNVALAMADRAVFLEKGRVRFEGNAQELLERDDLARAVFLGTEGG